MKSKTLDENVEPGLHNPRFFRLLWKKKKTSYRYTLNPVHYKNWKLI